MMKDLHERHVYLTDQPLKDAQARFLEEAKITLRTETIPVTEALHRVTAEDVYARVSMPNYHASAMDGIAVLARHTYGASERAPVRLPKDAYVWVNTGDALPKGTDAVIMIEDLHLLDDGSVELIEPVHPWQHIRPIGEDVVTGEMLVPLYHALKSYDLAALLAGGITEVKVFARPRVAILPTGDELIPPSTTVRPGEIIEFNSTMLAAEVRDAGGYAHVFAIVQDDPKALEVAVGEALKAYDIVLVNAGSSAGGKDHTRHVFERFGRVLTHGVATRPGKPVVLAVSDEEKKPLVGIPGYPVSAYLAMRWFVRPLLYRVLGQQPPEAVRVKARLGRRIVSQMGTSDFIRVSLGEVSGRLVANPLSRAAGVTTSLVRADGLITVPPEVLGYEQGETVEVELFHPLEAIKNKIVVTGSHDLTLDVITSLLRQKHPELSIASHHVGSMGGLLAIEKGETHVAGIHLLDPATGVYNIPFIERYVRSRSVILVHLVGRVQGWIVPKNNPRGIHSVHDLLQENLIFINRQRGSGTRILLDSWLKKEGIEASKIYGYTQEAVSHLAVAAQVASGEADVGLGILSAARAFDLDFIPLAEESYALLFDRSFAESWRGLELLNVIRSDAFKQAVHALGGYDTARTGEVVYERG
ncbi:MAG: molybdopterin biosynthesis protein [Candidatus Carbobacillus altaicus]|nr:molybdopterin biosynthesis protein [Candidatus Carbobacillus altaicus]